MTIREAIAAVTVELNLVEVLDRWSMDEDFQTVKYMADKTTAVVHRSVPPDLRESVEKKEYTLATMHIIAAVCLEAGRIIGRAESQPKGKIN